MKLINERYGKQFSAILVFGLLFIVRTASGQDAYLQWDSVASDLVSGDTGSCSASTYDEISEYNGTISYDISGGVWTKLPPGDYTYTAKDSDTTVSSITAPMTVTGISGVSSDHGSGVKVGTVVTLTATMVPNDGDPSNISWSGALSGTGLSVSGALGSVGTNITVCTCGNISFTNITKVLDLQLDAEPYFDYTEIGGTNQGGFGVIVKGTFGEGYTTSWTGDATGSGDDIIYSPSTPGIKNTTVTVTCDGATWTASLFTIAFSWAISQNYDGDTATHHYKYDDGGNGTANYNWEDEGTGSGVTSSDLDVINTLEWASYDEQATPTYDPGTTEIDESPTPILGLMNPFQEINTENVYCASPATTIAVKILTQLQKNITKMSKLPGWVGWIAKGIAVGGMVYTSFTDGSATVAPDQTATGVAVIQSSPLNGNPVTVGQFPMSAVVSAAGSSGTSKKIAGVIYRVDNWKLVSRATPPQSYTFYVSGSYTKGNNYSVGGTAGAKATGGGQPDTDWAYGVGVAQVTIPAKKTGRHNIAGSAIGYPYEQWSADIVNNPFSCSSGGSTATVNVTY